jgi:hypothetical protein
MATGRIGTTPVLTTRWSKAPNAGTTSLSGLDDNSVSLVYSVGYEAVYQNGVLLSRGNDYTATNGTTITLTTATVAGDIIEVFANQTIPLTDTYTQTVANGKFINNTLTTTTGDIIYASAANTPARLAIGSTDQVLKVSGGIPAWASNSASGVMLRYGGNNLTVATATNTTVNWNTENFDTDSFHSTTTNTSRITIPSGKAGKYLVVGTASWEGAARADFVAVRLYKNGSQIQFTTQNKSTGLSINTTLSVVVDLAVNDYLEMVLYQDSGSNLTFNGDNSYSYFGAMYLGA